MSWTVIGERLASFRCDGAARPARAARQRIPSGPAVCECEYGRTRHKKEDLKNADDASAELRNVASECHGRIEGPDVFGEAGAEAAPVHTVGLHCHMGFTMDPAFEPFSTDPARLRCCDAMPRWH